MISVGLIDVAMPAWEGVGNVLDHANATMKAIARAPIERASLRIVGSVVGEFDGVSMHASCFRSLPSQARNDVVAEIAGFAGNRPKKPLHEFAREMSASRPKCGRSTRAANGFFHPKGRH